MSSSKTIWIDMSDLSQWKGHFTGIQRVVYNIALRYSQDNAAVRFFCFDERARKFYEFDFASFNDGIVSQSGVRTTDTRPGRKELLLIGAKKIYTRTPSIVKKIAPAPKLKSVAKKGLGYYRRAKSLRQKIAPSTGGRQPVVFEEGDTVIVLGNTWDRPDLLLTLGAIKAERKILLFQVLYDMIPTFQPQAFNEELFDVYTKNMFEVLTLSDGLLAISKSTKKDAELLCEQLCITPPPISVIRLGDSVPTSGHPRRPAGFQKDIPFILCAGTIEARKNHALLYYAWKEGTLLGQDMPHLVIVGRPGWYTQDIVHAFKTDMQTRNKVTFLHNANDDELVWLYQNALFTIYPSYYEGWGLPVAESVAFGKLCLSSNQASMPEIAGDLIDYFSPFDSKGCAEKIIYYLTPSHLKKKEQTIQANYKLVSWDHTYQQVVRFVRELS